MAGPRISKEDEPPLKDPTSDDVWFGPTRAAIETKQPALMVYFIPRNPCFISYYTPFLKHLSTLLDPVSAQQRQTVVCGFTLPGFQPSKPSVIKGTLPANLTDQILNVEELIARASTRCGSTGDGAGAGQRTKIVLVAHSVGAYMTLEILRRRAQHLNGLAGMDIIRAVLLFPTVTEIAQSWHGSILSIFLYIPFFPAIVAFISRVLTFLLSTSTIARIISRLGGMPPHVASATAEFLKSPMGVYQALFLTVDEMAMIRHDKWDESIWGSSQLLSESPNQVVPLRFYFGAQDVWVSSKARDQLIRTRARRESEDRDSTKPVMVIDNEKIPHGFIVDHSERVAEKAQSMIEDLIDLNRNRSAPDHRS